ncbi:MAG: phenylacetic acid degradation operon negative regulatory protein PaaX [Bradyrhizobiaceae bacterium]|nr:phenylacetic acid degradation operon negative regulatory protein PaaX [Bradyrhizobiaceae bacterium]
MVARLLRRLKPKAKSVIITVYGDSITHHGGCAWLGSLIRLVAPLGLNERVVRTSVFRLVREDWLVAEQIGRRSYYRLTESGRRRVDAAHGRIYHRARRPWDRRWTFVITQAAAARRKALHDDLRWQGFGQLASGVMLHPDPDEADLRALLAGAGAERQVLVMRATAESPDGALREVIHRAWDMRRLAVDYTAFLSTFRPVAEALGAAGKLDPETCFAVRTLLMHAYRRVLLRDPKLPEELLEPDWPGTAARLLCRDLYRLVQAPAEQHLMAELETPAGGAPAAYLSYFSRFGGLDGPAEYDTKIALIGKKL